MPTDAVYDANVVAVSNGELAGRRAGNALDRRLRVLELCTQGSRRPRFNQHLLNEYEALIKTFRNDVVELFITSLETCGFRVKRNRVSSGQHGMLLKLGWPSHDQHLVAAALNGLDPEIYTTEASLGKCKSKIKREFGIQVVHL